MTWVSIASKQTAYPEKQQGWGCWRIKKVSPQQPFKTWLNRPPGREMGVGVGLNAQQTDSETAIKPASPAWCSEMTYSASWHINQSGRGSTVTKKKKEGALSIYFHFSHVGKAPTQTKGFPYTLKHTPLSVQALLFDIKIHQSVRIQCFQLSQCTQDYTIPFRCKSSKCAECLNISQDGSLRPVSWTICPRRCSQWLEVSAISVFQLALP